jgi:hypothetical protein
MFKLQLGVSARVLSFSFCLWLWQDYADKEMLTRSCYCFKKLLMGRMICSLLSAQQESHCSCFFIGCEWCDIAEVSPGKLLARFCHFLCWLIKPQLLFVMCLTTCPSGWLQQFAAFVEWRESPVVAGIVHVWRVSCVLHTLWRFSHFLSDPPDSFSLLLYD